jgi:hypothetical protein
VEGNVGIKGETKMGGGRRVGRERRGRSREDGRK